MTETIVGTFIDEKTGKKYEKEVPLDEWVSDENTGAKVMYLRPQNIPFCETHIFNKDHECTKCPFVYVGFRANLHLQRQDGIYERQTNKKLA